MVSFIMTLPVGWSRKREGVISFEQKILAALPTDEEKNHSLLLEGSSAGRQSSSCFPKNHSWKTLAEPAMSGVPSSALSRKKRSPSLPLLPLHHQLRSGQSVLCKINSVHSRGKVLIFLSSTGARGVCQVIGSLRGLLAAKRMSRG